MAISKIFLQRILFLYLMTVIFIGTCSLEIKKKVDVVSAVQRSVDIGEIDAKLTISGKSTLSKKTEKQSKKATFEPIKMNFPDIIRTGQAAIDYANDMIASFPKGAIDPNLIMTGKSCARGRGNIYKAVRFDTQRNQNFTVYYVCYNEKRASAIYSVNKVHLYNKALQKRTEPFIFKPLYTLFNKGIDGYYKAKSHTTLFNNTFYEPFTNENTALRYHFARTRLTPCEDFALVVDQVLTYFFHNCIPVYHSVNLGGLSRVELVIRQLSIRLRLPLTVYTGVYGNLRRWDRSHAELLDVYLDMARSRIEVPLVIWKLVINEATGESVAFFISNDVDLTAEKIAHFRTICRSDMSDELGFKFNQEPASGITVCCTYEDFVRHIRYLPVALPINSALLGAKASGPPKLPLGKAEPSSSKMKKPRRQPRKETFEPIKMNFPDIIRTGQDAIDYANELIKRFPRGAIDANLIMTGQCCARGRGNIYKVVRFDVHQNQNITVYLVCYDEKRASAIYSTHIVDLHDKELQHSKHTKFKPRYTLYNQGIDRYYKAMTHTTIFNATFYEPFTNENISLRHFFARNHLTPHADFALIIDQLLTYFFHNCIPGYQSVNADNVGHVEVIVRQLSIRLGVPLTIYTGVYGILRRWNRNHTEMLDVYLDMARSRIEVPLVIWKLAINEATGESVAFFTSNEANLTSEEITYFKTICKSDKSDELGFKFKQEPASGITVCCTYEDFVRHIQFLPLKLPINSGILGANLPVKLTKNPSKPTKPPANPTKLHTKLTKDPPIITENLPKAAKPAVKVSKPPAKLTKNNAKFSSNAIKT